MEEFELSIIYNGVEQFFKAQLQVTGYTHRFIVNVNGQTILFEPDEEKKYRALLKYEEFDAMKGIDQNLVALITQKLEELFF